MRDLQGFACGDPRPPRVSGRGRAHLVDDDDRPRRPRRRWRAHHARQLTAKEPGYSPPTIIEAGGTRQLIIWHPESINGLDPETGKVYWSVKQDTANGTSIMAPRVLDNQLFIGAWQRKGSMFKLDSDKPGATRVWKGDRDSSVYPISGTP